MAKYVEDYHANPFYKRLGILQEKYEFLKEWPKRRKMS